MNIIVLMNGVDVTASCRLSDTRINYDSTRRISTASLTVMGSSLAKAAKYDYAIYDEDRYSIVLAELFPVTILDGRDGTTKLFEGQIFTLEMEQSDAPTFEIFYKCELNDYASWLDRSVCWDSSFELPMPASDRVIIQTLLGKFCTRIDSTKDIAELVPVIMGFDWKTKTCRQVLDDIAALSMGEWWVDFAAVLHYGPASAAPAAPFELSTSPDYETSFPVKVGQYRHDFNNPINRAYVRGAAAIPSGVPIEASYADPVSIQQYGEFAYAVVDDQITTAWDAALRAKSTVLQYAYPIESGDFMIWQDGLRVGMNVHIHEDWLGIDGDYIIRSMTMQWEDQWTVRYEAQFGAAKADLETILRLLEQRARWKTSNLQAAASGPPSPGSVTDASIAAGGLHAQSIATVNAGSVVGVIEAVQIGTVNATSIIGQLEAGQILSVNAGAIVGAIVAGQIQSVGAQSIQGAIVADQIESVHATTIQGALAANQIGSVNATTIQGSLTAGQIESVNATSIQGVIVSSQLANQIIDNLAKYAEALRPVRVVKIGDPWPPPMPNPNFPPNAFFYFEPDGHFYRVTPDGTTWVQNDNPQAALMNFYQIGRISATSIVGLIVAAQIQSIQATQITGSIQAGQIGTVSAGSVTGKLTANQMESITAGQITGQLKAGQIESVNASSISGQITATQIATVNASAIQGTISSTQIQSVNAGQISGTLAYNQIGSINAATITIGLIQDGQVQNISGGKLIVGTVSSDKLNTYSIDVGDAGAGGMPGRIRVFGGALMAQIGYLGEIGAGAYGGWFKVFGAGGTSWGDARVYTDTSGNLWLRNVDFNVSGQIYTSTQTFDATYSTLAFKNDSWPDMTSFVSRGLVFYYGGGKIGSLVRSPNGGYLELECTTGGGYVLINGSAGVRSDAGYLVGGSRVINSSGQFTGTVTGAVTGTVQGPVSTNSSIFTNSTCQAQAGYYGGGFFGSSVSVSGSCNASGGYTGGSFQGSGVSVGSYGVSCGYLTTNGNTVDTGILNASSRVSTNNLYLGGKLVFDSTGILTGPGVQCNSEVMASRFAIYGVAFGVTETVTISGVSLRFIGGIYCGH